jgi:hypothetical protein
MKGTDMNMAKYMTKFRGLFQPSTMKGSTMQNELARGEPLLIGEVSVEELQVREEYVQCQSAPL